MNQPLYWFFLNVVQVIELVIIIFKNDAISKCKKVWTELVSETAKKYIPYIDLNRVLFFLLPAEVNPMYNLVERVNDIYNSVIQSETCMERIACEVGGLAGDMGVRETARYFLRFKHPSHSL